MLQRVKGAGVVVVTLTGPSLAIRRPTGSGGREAGLEEKKKKLL